MVSTLLSILAHKADFEPFLDVVDSVVPGVPARPKPSQMSVTPLNASVIMAIGIPHRQVVDVKPDS